jgi:peptidoglycan/xylan/chitin deacetylase (PgdA/CDA1 family)
MALMRPHYAAAFRFRNPRPGFWLIATCCAVLSFANVDAARGGTKTAPDACPSSALGTSRTLALGTQGGFAIGLKTYPQTLALADHEVVLTFDDGPGATTPRVLDALAKECVHATFFLIGRNAAANPALVKREVADGHTVGHHTFSHPAETLRLISDAKAREDIDKGFAADDLAAYGKVAKDAAVNVMPRVPFFRFPGFADTPALDAWLKSRNIGIFGADLWASDWLDMSPNEELQLVLARLDKEGRGILLLHDTRRSTALMLPRLLVELKKRGYRIVHLVASAGPRPALREAPHGWRSETEDILADALRHSRTSKRPSPHQRHPSRMPEPGL